MLCYCTGNLSPNNSSGPVRAPQPAQTAVMLGVLTCSILLAASHLAVGSSMLKHLNLVSDCSACMLFWFYSAVPLLVSWELFKRPLQPLVGSTRCPFTCCDQREQTTSYVDACRRIFHLLPLSHSGLCLLQIIPLHLQHLHP